MAKVKRTDKPNKSKITMKPKQDRQTLLRSYIPEGGEY